MLTAASSQADVVAALRSNAQQVEFVAKLMSEQCEQGRDAVLSLCFFVCLAERGFGDGCVFQDRRGGCLAQ